MRRRKINKRFVIEPEEMDAMIDALLMRPYADSIKFVIDNADSPFALFYGVAWKAEDTGAVDVGYDSDDEDEED